MYLIDSNIENIKKLCTNYKVNQLYAFGSVLTKEFHKDSDIDLIVDFAPMDIAVYADNYFNFKDSLQNLLKRRVDLLEEKAIKNPFFKQNVDQYKKLIYGRTSVLTC